MDLKEPGHILFLIGTTRDEMGGSHFNLVTGAEAGEVPQVDLKRAPLVFRKVHEAIQRGLIRACHDLSEGGLAAAIAEMALAGDIGADLTSVQGTFAGSDEVRLFSESTTRFVVETTPANSQALRDCLTSEVPMTQVGQTCKEPRLRIAGANGEWLIWAKLSDLREAWQKPLRF
jgi:phosphoribosylformylglycinamidine synthase